MKTQIEIIRKWSDENNDPTPALWALPMAERDAIFEANARAAEQAIAEIVDADREDLAEELAAIPQFKYIALGGRICPGPCREAQSAHAVRNGYKMTPLRRALGY